MHLERKCLDMHIIGNYILEVTLNSEMIQKIKCIMTKPRLEEKSLVPFGYILLRFVELKERNFEAVASLSQIPDALVSSKDDISQHFLS